MGAKEQGLEKSQGRYQVVPRVLVFVTNGSDVLLLKGSPDKPIWPGLYNGIGGHVEQDETVYEAVQREVLEETGLNEITSLRLRGIINIDAKNPTGIMLFVFTAVSSSRTVRPSSEGTPEWVNWREIDSQVLVKDLPMLLPRVLSMQPTDPPFFARYWYDEDDALRVLFDPQGADI